MGTRRLQTERIVLGLTGAVLVGFLLAPLVALGVATSTADFAAGLRNALVWPALRLSLFTTLCSLVIVVTFGTPLAWMLATMRGRLPRAIETCMQLPLVIPPAAAGIALLLAFGRRGIFSGVLYPQSWAASFTTAAVVMAEVFVSAPYFVQAATSAFRRIDPQLLLVARSLGARPLRVFARVGAPLAAPGLIAGAAMSWARSLGEFGATLMFAGNLQGETQTLPLAIYTALESDMRAAQALSIILVVVAYALLLGVRTLLARASGSPEGWR